MRFLHRLREFLALPRGTSRTKPDDETGLLLGAKAAWSNSSDFEKYARPLGSHTRVTVLRRLLERALYCSNIAALLRRTVWRRRVGIALYHSIAPELFEAHLQILTSIYNLIPLDTLVRALRQNDWSGIPNNGLVITFDAGARDFYELRELLHRHNLSVTHYVVSSMIGTNRHFWFDEVGDEDLVESLKDEPHSMRLAPLAENHGFAVDKEYETRQVLSLEEIGDLTNLGTDIGAHTASHPILPTCDDETAFHEIVTSQAQLEAKIGAPVRHFCYPSGAYCERDEELVRQANYRSARTTERGLNDQRTNPYRLRVVDALEDRSPADLRHIELRLLWYKIKQFFGVSRSMPGRRR